MGSARRKMCKKVFFTDKSDRFKVHLAIHRATAQAPFGWLRSSERWCQNHLWTEEPFALAFWHRQSTFARCRGRPLLYFEACPIKKFSHKIMSESKHFCFRAAKITQEWDKTRPNQEKNVKKLYFACQNVGFCIFLTALGIGMGLKVYEVRIPLQSPTV